MAKIYVASSWRNQYFPEVVKKLREYGHEVYDFNACLLVLPCGRSAHTEAGWMKGAGKKVIVYIPEMQEAELMYKLFDLVSGSLEEVNQFL